MLLMQRSYIKPVTIAFTFYIYVQKVSGDDARELGNQMMPAKRQQ
jgi:hypothetical protein